MADKIYYPETIDGNPFPVSGETVTPAGVTFKSATTLDSLEGDISNNLPSSFIASALISSSLNSQSRKILGNYSFGVLGAIQIGKYASGVTGDIRITPTGITARNSAGATTFSIDGSTGSATFLGTVAAGSIVTGYIAVGGAAGDVNSGSTTISGGKITTNSIAADRIVTGSLVVGTNVGLGTAQDSAGVTTIVGNVVTTGYVNALNITANSVIAGWVYAGNISAAQINAGNLSATYIKGGTLSLGGNANENGVLRIKDSAGNTGVYGDNQGLVLFDDRFNTIAWGTSGGTAHGAVLYSGGVFYVGSYNSVPVTISSASSINFNPSGANKVEMGNNIDMNEHDIDACHEIWAYHFSNRCDVFNGDPFEIMQSFKAKQNKIDRWVKLDHKKLNPDVYTSTTRKIKTFTKDKEGKTIVKITGEEFVEGYDLGKLVEIQRVAILKLQEKLTQLEKLVERPQ